MDAKSWHCTAPFQCPGFSLDNVSTMSVWLLLSGGCALGPGCLVGLSCCLNSTGQSVLAWRVVPGCGTDIPTLCT